MKNSCSVAKNSSAITNYTQPPAKWRHNLLLPSDNDSLCPMGTYSRGEEGDGPI